jgi:hypothetical protein
MSPGMLVIERPKAASRDQWRSYLVIVDGVRRGKIRRGDTMRMELPPGIHHVKGEIDWGSSESLEIEVSENSTTRLRLEPGGSAWHFWDVGKGVGYLKLTRISDDT